MLRRPRLDEALANGLDGGTVLVVAPAGYGKTTVVTEWLRESSMAAAWLSLNAAHRTALNLVGDIIEALARVHPSVEPLRAQVAAGEGSQRAIDQVGALFDALEQADDYAVLVVDAGYVLRDADEACAIVDHIIDGLPSSLGLVVLARERPPLQSLARHLAGGMVTMLDASELAFTSDEASALLEQLHTPEAIRELVMQRAGGWPLALALLGRRGDRPMTGESRILDADLDEFIRSEVVDPLPESDRTLLEACAVPAHFDGDIAAEVSGRNDAPSVLHSLEMRTGLITGVGDGRWLRMHALLREHCLARLNREDPARLGTYRARAARSLVRAGELDEATELALDAEAWLQARDLILEQADALTGRGAWDTLADWIGRLPPAALSEAPELALLRVRAQIWLMRLSEAHEQLDHLERVLTEPRDQARALLYRGIAWRQARRLDDALAIQRQARRIFEEVEPDGSDLRIEADIEEGTVLGMRGELAPAVALLERAARDADAAGRTRLGGHARLNLGLALQFAGRLTEAGEAFREARRRWEHLGETELRLLTLNNEATSSHMRGELQAAETTYTDVASIANHRGRFGALAALGLADIERDRGQLERAEELYAEALDLARQIDHRGVEAAATFGRAMLTLDRGSIDDARAQLDGGLRIAEMQSSGEFASRFEIGLATVLLVEGRDGEALDGFNALLEAPGRGYQRRQAALLLRATAEFRLGRTAEAEATLLELHELVQSLGYDQYVVAEVHRCADLLASHLARGVAGGYFARLAGRARQAAALGVEAPPQPTYDLVVSAFGAPTVSRPGTNDADLPWRSERSKELLLLLLAREVALPREEIEEALWPESPPAQLSSLFHNNLHRLRRTVGESTVLRSREGYRLNPELRIDFDVRRFERHLAAADEAGHGGDDALRIQQLRAAVRMYVGPFARPFDSPWVQDLRARLEDRYVAGALALARLDIAAGEHSEAVDLAESVLEIDGLNEEAVRHLIAAHVGAGFPDLALRAYRRLQDLSERELGVSLSGETRRALERTLSGLG